MKEFLLKNLSAGYEGKAVVHGVSASVSPGEILVLLGCNGAGKSTVLMTAAGLLPVIEGNAELDGIGIESIAEKERARRMSVLLPEDIKQKGVSCREAVELGRYPYTGYFGHLSEEDRKKVEEVMTMCGVMDIADRDYGKLSDGQRQRVRLARCLAQEPEVMLLDEPTIFLDVHYQAEFMALLIRLAKEKHIAVMMSMHDPELALCVADRLLCLKDGTVHSYGTPEELTSDGSLRSLYGLDELAATLKGQQRLKTYIESIGREK